ncbi:MAG: zinc ribbon domain-containing protein [Oscillospiraceae bacterium]|nr:zinc ribbon domain-containing protein [Oscillospiraceae bacterium]
MRECSRCRARLDPDAVFCEVCGTPVQGGTPIAPSAQPVRQIPPAQPVQKRSHTGLIVVCAILLLASVGSGIFLAGGIRAYRDAGSTNSTETSSEKSFSLFGGGQKQDAGAALLPDGAELRRDATAGDVKGVWSGSFTFDVLEGLEDMEGAPADIGERVAQIKATPAAMTIELGDGGQWSLELDAMGGFDMRERDLKSESRPDGIPWTGPTDGVMTVDSGTFDEGGAKGSMKLEMAAGTDAQGALLGGQFSVTMENGGVQVEMQGHFTLRPDHEEQEGS